MIGQTQNVKQKASRNSNGRSTSRKARRKSTGSVKEDDGKIDDVDAAKKKELIALYQQLCKQDRASKSKSKHRRKDKHSAHRKSIHKRRHSHGHHHNTGPVDVRSLLAMGKQ